MSGMNGSPVPGGCTYYPVCSKCKHYNTHFDSCKKLEDYRNRATEDAWFESKVVEP